MKRIIYTAVMMSSLFISTSCVDLEQTPPSFITEEEYLASMDLDALEKAVTALYKDMWQGNYGFNARIQRISVSADDITYSPTKANNTLDYYERLSPDLFASGKDDSGTLWGAFYNVINNSNKLINKTVLPNDEKSAKEYQKVLGEALFMRGLSYFYIVRLFGDAPLILKEEDAGKQMPRTSVSEIYEKAIVPSLEQACAWLPTTPRANNSSTPSQWAAKACLSDVYMTMAGWPLKKGTEYYAKAEVILKDIIDNSGLTLTGKYEDLWKEELKNDINEHLFALHHSAKQGGASNYGKSYYPKDFYPKAGWADYYAEEDFFLAYPEGERKEWNFMTEWDAGTKANHKITNYKESVDGLPAISKYYNYDNGAPGNSAQANGITSIYRYADVLLMYAEASTKATNSVGTMAAKALKDVQERAKSSVITDTTDPATFEKAVFDENGWEFFAEMRRWFDLVRLEKVKDVKPEEWSSSLFNTHGHYYMPIPEEQISLTGWQNNSGY